MKRRRKTRRGVKSYEPRQPSVEEPFPHFVMSGSECKYIVQPKHQVSISNVDSIGCCCYIFAADFAAKKFLDHLFFLAQGERPKWSGTSSFQLGPLEVRSPLLDEIVEYELTEKERQWSLPVEYPRSLVSQWHNVQPIEPTREKARRGEYVKARREGLVTALQLAEEYDVDAKELRQLFRAVGLKKPTAGWAWDECDLEPIRKIIEGAIES